MRFDADAATRWELVRKSRYFERNSAIYNRIIDVWEEYTVGPSGLRIVPASSDEEWNKRATEYWNAWQKMCDIGTRQSFGTVQSLVARSWAVDGELFILKTYGKDRPDKPAFPRIQLIETHRVQSPPDEFNAPDMIDGISIDKNGRPIFYSIKSGIGTGEKFELVEAEDVIHVFEPSRPGQYRGLPVVYPVINDLHDLDDLQILEMDAAKEAAKTTSVIHTATGEIEEEALRRARFGIGGTSGTSGGSAQERSQYYEDVFEGRVKVLRPDDKYEQFQSSRPSVVTQAYWDYLTSKVCAGIGISKLLVFPWSMQGTVTRADLDVQSAFFRSRSSVLISAFTQIYEFVMWHGTKSDRTLADPPADWRKINVRPPRSVNVDVGRNSSAMIAEYEAGFRTLEGICGELGDDWREVLYQRGIERAAAKKIEKALGLDEGELIQAALEAIKSRRLETPEPARQ